MDQQTVWREVLDFATKPIVVEPVAASLSVDAGLLPLRQLDEALGFTEQFAAALADDRGGGRLSHSFLEMARSRIYGILAGYEDCNDHDALRHDAVFKLLAGRMPDDADLASQPTLSRFENAIGPASLFRLEDVLLEQFLDSFAEPPKRLTFDVDVFDDPTHGQQQLTFFHGFYEQYQYLPRVLTCAENDMVVMTALLYGTARAGLGLEDDLAKLVARIRERWPTVRLLIRADSGFATPALYDCCEQLGIGYTIGLGMNSVLKARSEECLNEALRQYEESRRPLPVTTSESPPDSQNASPTAAPTENAADAQTGPGQPQRLFTAFEYQAASWPAPRWVVVKCEANAQGTNRRAIVTNRPGAYVLPGAAYDEYAERGESENRNKELKCGLRADRLSCHRFMANYFRLYLHCAAANLLVRLRHVVANPPDALLPTDSAAARVANQPEPAALPADQLGGADRKRHFNRRRLADPLGEGQPNTWRMLLFKVAAEVVTSTRRVCVRLSGAWPYLNFYRQVCAAVSRYVASGAG